MKYFDVHTHIISSDKNVVSILNTYPNSIDFSHSFSIGLHPWYINREKVEEELLRVELKLQHKNCFALGECGLDTITKVDFDVQKSVFRKQIALSEKYQKPLMIHCVKAHQEIISLKKEIKPMQQWVLHGFNKNLQLAQSLLKNGIVVSFGAAIISHKKLQEVVLEIPLENMLLETDDNTDLKIQEIYQKVAVIKKIEVKELQQKIAQNFKRIFKG
ncbi:MULTISPECIES: TatD family hydrolase [unclassified Polaribacter]|uniref:TatD family hydrolase n=1 Tax=unclassified Polaribacter TaxID=196858 RepID=UPI001CB96498|nr:MULTISPECIES: TatD family hydrolase [unclassified Polaribacter]